jgi:glucosyl-dolichyl phosphate glucuronosyltransferase
VTAPAENLSVRLTLTIIIPTYNRRPSLQRLLESIDRLEIPASSRVEVVVVNNASRDETAALLSDEIIQPKSTSFVVLTEFNKGKASALNRGLTVAKGDYILVLDDDVVADSSLIMEHLKCYEENSFDAVQGRILPGVDPEGKSADVKRLQEYNIPIIDHGPTCREINGLTGTNMSFKRAVFEKVGSFHPDLGPGAAGFSEDTEYSIRIREAGFKIGYTPGAVVYHELNPNRYGRKYKRRIEYRKGLSRSIYRSDSVAFKVIPDLIANCIRYGVYRSLGLSQKAYKTEGRIMKRWGYLIGKIVGVESADKHRHT